MLSHQFWFPDREGIKKRRMRDIIQSRAKMESGKGFLGLVKDVDIVFALLERRGMMGGLHAPSVPLCVDFFFLFLHEKRTTTS